jgi:type IV pilus assembly protein PilE
MMPCMAKHRRTLAGFTLIELLVTVVVVALLASIAIPSYVTSVRKSRRTEARNALLDLAGREERYMGAYNSYSAAASDLGYSVFPSPTATSYYTISVTQTQPGSATSAPYFQAMATPVSGNGQDKDTSCQSFMVDSTGAQTSTNGPNGTGTVTTSTCWGQ